MRQWFYDDRVYAMVDVSHVEKYEGHMRGVIIPAGTALQVLDQVGERIIWCKTLSRVERTCARYCHNKRHHFPDQHAEVLVGPHQISFTKP